MGNSKAVVGCGDVMAIYQISIRFASKVPTAVVDDDDVFMVSAATVMIS